MKWTRFWRDFMLYLLAIVLFAVFCAPERLNVDGITSALIISVGAAYGMNNKWLYNRKKE